MSITADTLRLQAELDQDLTRITDAQTRDLVAAWALAWDEVAPDLREALVEQLVAGNRISRTMLLRSTRLRGALSVVAAALEDLAAASGVRITRDLQAVVATAGAAQASIIDSQLPAGFMSPEDLASWGRVDGRQIAAIVERSTEQITALHRPLAPVAYEMVRRELIRGVAAGSNPRATAVRMLRRSEGRFNGGLNRALVISRTETLDAHRAAAQLGQEPHTDVLTGWEWLAKLDARTCPSCWAQHGSVHDGSEPGPLDHQQGRCGRLPKTESWENLGFEGIEEPPDLMPDAEAQFWALSREQQLQVLGPRRYEAWLAGDFPMSEWSRRRESDGWRDSYAPASAPKAGGGSSSGGGSQPPPTGGGDGGGDGGGGDPFEGIPYAPGVVRHPDLSALTEDETDQIAYYASSGYRFVNEAMRGRLTMTDEIRESIDLIRSGLEKYPLPQTVRVTRTTDLEDIGVSSYDGLAGMVGHEIVQRAFLSTSVAADPPAIGLRADPVYLELVVPAGTPALAITGPLVEPGQEHERELLVIDARRIQIRRVESDDTANPPRWRVWATVIGGASDGDAE